MTVQLEENFNLYLPIHHTHNHITGYFICRTILTITRKK
ncbi:hypothetical protein XBJ1_4081 [Xenorhabdus bovienii SS-2004]|uniref:Uncharacterized protein n=1 Tax=Xenorhabdus bovienii (strain SS-2004) TaxID=406818 RepID=D3V6B4_XENBS|nr:hypothetical protein XBJ1_4081 [Xenorhabdus bovienii SS-2004]